MYLLYITLSLSCPHTHTLSVTHTIELCSFVGPECDVCQPVFWVTFSLCVSTRPLSHSLNMYSMLSKTAWLYSRSLYLSLLLSKTLSLSLSPSYFFLLSHCIYLHISPHMPPLPALLVTASIHCLSDMLPSLVFSLLFLLSYLLFLVCSSPPDLVTQPAVTRP